MAAVNFTYTAAAPPLVPTHLSISQNPLPAGGPGVELDTAANARAGHWAETKTGKILSAGANPGIFTVSQFQCMAIALAIIPIPGAAWTQCHLTHISHKLHSMFEEIINVLNVGNHAHAYIVIGGRAVMRDSMDFIRTRLMNLQTLPAHVWIYAAADQLNFGFWHQK